MESKQVLDERYEIGEHIGRGGMADVYLAKDLRLGRTVAIKVLRSDLARDPLFQSRFRREAQAVAALNHPSIVSVFDTGEEHVQDGSSARVTVPFIVMEYVAGRTLRDLIKSGEVTQTQAVTNTMGILAALEYSHRAGIVHRDIKPANVMITPEGRVKVMDFGIARAIADSAATMTQTQAVVGTAQYLSPEQARGETVDARSDLYSAGCVLYEMLTGRPPFMGDSPVSVAYQHVRELAQKPSEFNPTIANALDVVTMHALTKDRSARFQDAASFGTALEAARKGIAPAEISPGAEAQTEAQSQVNQLAAPTRAMAKVMSGGPLTVGEPVGEGRAPGDTGELDAADTGTGRSLQLTDFPQTAAPKKKSRAGWIIALIVLALALAAAATFLVSQYLKPKPAPTVTIPDVSTMQLNDAQNALTSEGLSYTVEHQFNDKVSKGSPISTDPPAGRAVDPTTKVVLYVSDGPANITIPGDLAGQSEAQAYLELQNLGIKPTSTRQDHPTLGAGLVIASKPGANQKVAAGSTVELVISTGQVKVPNFVNKSIEEVRQLCQDPALGFRCEEQEREYTGSEIKEGTVTQTVPGSGSEMAQGGTLTVIVATKPEPTPTPTSEPSTSNSPSPSPSS